MAETIERWKSELGSLPAKERAELAHFLLTSLEPEEQGAAAAWEAEVDRRVAEIRGGRAAGKPAEQVFADIREQLP
jgi:putative addiction module component (TIGR02574 family)